MLPTVKEKNVRLFASSLFTRRDETSNRTIYTAFDYRNCVGSTLERESNHTGGRKTEGD